MKVKPVSGILLTLLLIGTLTLAFNIQPVRASGTIYIRPDGTVEGTDKIQRDGDLYTFTDNIHDEIFVERDNIVLDGAGYSLQGTGTVNSRGIDLADRSNVTIKNMEIEEFSYGIYLNHSANCNIKENTLTSIDFECIRLYESSRNGIIKNTIILNDIDGITLYGSSNNNIAENHLRNNYDGIRLYESSNNSITENTVIENYYGISLTSSSNSNITNNNATSNHGTGINLDWSSNNNTISANTLTNNDYGILVKISSNNIIIGNEIMASMYTAIGLYYSPNNVIVRNNVANNHAGIYLPTSSNNNIIGNTLKDNYEGVMLDSSSTNNIISGNSITNNQKGVYLYDSSKNSIHENCIASNEFGIRLCESYNNTFYHNNLRNNTQEVSDCSQDWPEYYPPSINVWDDGYPSGGNYWSDHVTVDDYSGINQDEPGSDGIVDEPYTIDADNQDAYPLMGPISSFDAGTWGETTYQVNIVSNSTVSDFIFSESEKLISFNVTGLDDTVGFCRVTISNVLLGGPYVVLINDFSPLTIDEQSNGTHTFLYFTYDHSTKPVEITGTTVIPEFSSWISMPLLFAVFASALVIYKRRLLKTPTH